MTGQELIKRFEELDAGRILGDLDDLEIREWNELSKDPRCITDGSLELVAAAVENELMASIDEPMPKGLLAKIRYGKADFVVSESSPLESSNSQDNVIHVEGWRAVFANVKVAWGIAALFAIFLVAQTMVITNTGGKGGAGFVTPAKPAPQLALAELVEKDPGLDKKGFGGLGSYGEMSGEVAWSDELQEGYMTLTNLPANDPKTNQYQLWIVDATRDANPVDGGVFDIPADGESVVVPIRSALAVNQPTAFVITLEQPGGVVVSKQETVVALAGTL